MKKLFFLVSLALACATHAQTTNVVPPRLKLTLAEGGVFVHYSAEVGRIYRLEESITLTNWILVDQKVADATNMSFYFENFNMTLMASMTSGTNNPGPAPLSKGANSLASTEDTTASSSKPSKPKDAPLPYPWEPAYQPKPRDHSTISADSTQSTQSASASESVVAPEAKFYRVVVPDPRIQFPNWMSFVDQYMSFDVWTSITNGTYRMELYRDGVGIYTNVAAVPANGFFRVHDGTYNAANWPFTGYYSAGEWELRVTVTPPASLEGGEAPAQTTVKKPQRRPANAGVRRGLVVNMEGLEIFGPIAWPPVEQDFINEMLFTFSSCYIGALQVDLNYAWRNEFTTTLENLTTVAEWTKLKTLIFGLQTILLPK